MQANDRTKSLLLQALRWRLTRSLSGEQRDTVVDAYISNDLFGCRPASKQNGYSLVQLLRSPSITVRQYTARLYNAISSLQKGRAYLCGYPSGVRHLLTVLLQLDEDSDRITKEHLLGCLQKLSLRRSLQTIMIEGDMITWLVKILLDFQSLSDYMLEYAIALLMNLCLRSTGKRKCAEIAEDALRVLSKLLAHENSEIRPYVNGALYSILSDATVRYIAQDMGLEEILKDLMDGEQDEFKRQLQFIIRQLNADPSSDEVGNESDDENDDDDDEDQDAMEADLDKDEILQLRSGELSGENFLCADYLGIMTHTQNATSATSLLIDGGIPHRPTTPSHYRVAAETTRSSMVNGSRSMDDTIDNVDLSMSYPSTLVAESNSLQDARPPTASTPRPRDHPQSRPTTSKRAGGSASGSRPGSTSSVRSTGSRSIRKMPLDEESSRLVADKTGAVRSLAPPATQVLPHPSGSKLEDDPDGIKEYTTVFSSRPRILRTPDVSNHSQRAPAKPFNPTYSQNEPRSRPNSSSSWRGSRGSVGSNNGHNSHASISSPRKQN